MNANEDKDSPKASSAGGENQDKKRLNDWIQKYKPLLKSIAAKEIDKELAEKIDASDVVQETLSAVQASIDEVTAKPAREIKGYLRRTLLSKIGDLRRRFLGAKKRDVRREVTSSEISSDEIRQIPSGIVSQLDLMIDEERMRRVMDSVQALPSEIQQVLRWRFEQDMTFQQIGDRIGRSKDDVRMLLQRCIMRLKTQLDES